MITGGQSFVSSPPAFSNDGKKLLICTGATVSIFSTSTGLQITELEGHIDRVTSVVVVPVTGPASKFMSFCWTSSLDGTVCYWDFAVPELMKKVNVQLPVWSMPWHSSSPLVENNIRYSFVTYVRVRSNSDTELNAPSNDVATDCQSEKEKFEVERFSFLPKMIFDRHEEYMYIKLVDDIISTGTQKSDRTGTGTLSKFGCQMRFNLRRSFPLLTTKKVFWRGVVEELLWFISGSTNAKVLQEKGIHIWDGNASREYLDSVGLSHREEGDLGPIYGFQWRHYGAEYTDMHADYSGKGFDQLMDVIDKIKNNPDDRRIILSAWNPSDLIQMALPPCHMFAQFYVENGELSCQMYQRSADMGLGVPFNIASYSLLTCIIAHVCGLVPGEFVHVLGDAHVYRNHVRPLQEQLQKQPKPFPVLKINPLIKDIDSFVASDFKLIGYDPHYKIEMKMAI
ncbi:hypothetical protein J5N97_028016 [Dioscorea zingiberensis]|uniref:thymidylate synthase n=1 Tax=Dioscorea zingiberensis TaxID=325984 RepID=A0A9D5BYA1_9LILI|nr:hypothetical protein J5N97_028016 [Dioscorea zingiberensis]